MLSSRLVSFSALLAIATGCAASGVRTNVTPDNGPVARIHATYSGGLTQRTLRANFTVDRPGYVLVGHLRGDGVIEILYPENARVSNAVQRGKTYSVGPVSANYDAVPQLFNYSSRAFRSVGARTDSYDGRGNGFVFVIASRYPLYLDDLQDHGYWNNDYEVDDYSWTSDPRESIRYFADGVTRGAPFTLKYANSFGSNAMLSYASNQYDCALLSHFYGYGSMLLDPGFGYWGSSFSSYSWSSLQSASYYGLANTNWYAGYGALSLPCGSRYSLGYLLGSRPSWSYSPTYFTPVSSAPPTTPRTGTPVVRRLVGARGDEQRPGLALTRTRLDPPRQTTSTWSSPSSRPARDPEVYRPPREASPYTPRITVHDPSPRTSAPATATPAASAPRSLPPKIEASSGKPREP